MNISDTIITFTYCLLGTILIETILAWIFKVRDKLDIIYVILVQVLTNPLLVGIQLFIRSKYSINVEMISVWIMEVIVVFVEGFVYSKVLNYNKINPYILSFILNGLSYGIGFIISNYLIGVFL